jgi:hypothetical protein
MSRGPHVATIEVTVWSARPPEGERLREIAIASKSTWGYTSTGCANGPPLGTSLTKDSARKSSTLPMRQEKLPAGPRTFRRARSAGSTTSGSIPPEWGRGLGTLLVQHAVARGRQVGAVRLEWQAERRSVGCYEKIGGRYLRDSEPGVWGRVNAVMSIDLS